MLVESQGATLVGVTGQTIDFESDVIDITTKDSAQRFKEYLYGEKGFTLSIDGLYDPEAVEGVSEAIDRFKQDTVVSIKWGEFANTGDKYFSGSALLQRISVNGPKNEAASYSFTLQGTGVPTEETVV